MKRGLAVSQQERQASGSGDIEKCPEGTFLAVAKRGSINLGFKSRKDQRNTVKTLSLMVHIVDVIAGDKSAKGKTVRVGIKWVTDPGEGPKLYKRCDEFCAALGTPAEFDEENPVQAAKFIVGKPFVFSMEYKSFLDKATGETIAYDWADGFVAPTAEQAKLVADADIRYPEKNKRFGYNNWIAKSLEDGEIKTIEAAIIAKYADTVFDFSDVSPAREPGSDDVGEEAPF